jgi:hypothetical protein
MPRFLGLPVMLTSAKKDLMSLVAVETQDAVAGVEHVCVPPPPPALAPADRAFALRARWLRARSNAAAAYQASDVTRAAAGQPRPSLETPYESPADTIERALAAIWASTFGLRDVGVNDDFFALHGDAPLAARLLAQVNVALGLQLSLAAFFAAPTVRGLAVTVLEARLSTLEADTAAGT